MNSPAKRSARISCSPPPDDRIKFSMDMQSAEVRSTRAFRLGDFLRDQLRNIAPFITLIALVAFFSIASPTFATLGNLENILQQVSATAIMAVGLTLVLIPADSDRSLCA